MDNSIFVSILCLIILAMMPSSSFASICCDEMKLGWHFYCDPEKHTNVQSKQTNGSIEQAKAELEQIKIKLEDLKIRAVIYPTEANTLSYIAFQQEQLERAAKFSQVWQRVLRSNPHLDYTVATPISGIGNQLVQEVKKQDINNRLAKLNERFGLFFFYNSQCVHCLKYSPLLKVFSSTYGIKVMPISIDGGFLSEWPDSLVNKGQFEKLGLFDKPVPATILFDNKTKKLLPIGFGLLTVSELEERIYIVLNEEGSYE